MGADGSGAAAEERVRPLRGDGAAGPRELKPAAERLYGRTRGKALRPRQARLLEVTLPRLRFREECVGAPLGAFAGPVKEVWLEVGFGGGEHALAQAAATPGAGLIACEVFENGLCSLLSRLVAEGEEATGALPGNLLIWPDDARLLLREMPAGSLSRLFLLFPDPWPKARHAKRRFVHPDQIALAARAMAPGGEWRIATDDPTYQEWVVAQFAAQDAFEAGPAATARPEGWPATRYEAKALREGRRPLYWTMRRR